MESHWSSNRYPSQYYLLLQDISMGGTRQKLNATHVTLKVVIDASLLDLLPPLGVFILDTLVGGSLLLLSPGLRGMST